MKIAVLGVRGMPNVQGGVETHAEQLYSRLARLGCDVEVIVRTPFVERGRVNVGPIRLRRIWSPRRPGVEAFVHSILGVLYAGIKQPDILHVHAVGPAIVVPLARLFGLRVVVTHHGEDYNREKWGGFARRVLKMGERLGMRHSHARIAVSNAISQMIRVKYQRDSDVIRNGVAVAARREETDIIRRFGLEPGRYFLHVARVAPEKRQLDLISAFASLEAPQWKLVLVGGLSQDGYSRSVEGEAKNAGVVLAGFLAGAALEQMYSHAGAFVLPSSHEGFPIAMLEALSFGLPVLASDIAANREVGLPAGCYFAVGDVSALADKLLLLMQVREDEAARAERTARVRKAYDWDHIAGRTLAIYQRVIRDRRPASAAAERG